MTDPRRTAQWRRFRLTILERDGGLCQIRGKGCTVYANAVDHVVQLSKTAPELRWAACFSPSNCRAACTHCNSSREARRMNRRRAAQRRRERMALGEQ